jgi:O-antigen/teichoic acid export membrane protein
MITRRIRSLATGGLAKDTSWALGAEALTVVVLTVSFALLGRRLGPQGYGAFVGLYGLLGPAISINQSAVGLAIYEHIVGRKESSSDVAASCLSSTLVIGLVLSGAVVGLGSLLLPSLPLSLLVLFALGEMIVTSVLMMSIAVVQSVRGFAAATRLRILSTTFRGIAIVVLAAFGQLTLRNLALGQVTAAFVALVIVAHQVRRHLGHLVLPGPIRWDTMKSIGTYASGISASSFQASGDKVVLNTAGHVADAGLYGAAYRIIMMAQIPVNALLHSTHLSFLERDGTDPVKLCVKYSKIAFAYAAVAVIGLMVLAPVVPFVLGSDFDGTTDMIRWLSPIVLLSAITSFPANGLLTYDRNALRTKIVTANAAFSVVLYVALIPPFSWRGAIAATVISEITMTVTTWTALLLVRRQTRRQRTSAADVVSV